MTPPLPELEPQERTEPTPSLKTLLSQVARYEDETRAALAEVNARLEELLKRETPAELLSTPVSQPKDVAARHAEYLKSTARLHDAAREKIPAGAQVLVISKGDDALLRMGGRRAQHFPQGPDGRYAGFHPADSAAAIVQLDALAARGAQFLVIPAASLWWLEHYREFAEHVASGVVFRDDAIGAIYALSELEVASSTRSDFAAAAVYRQLEAVVCNLLPAGARLLVISKGDPQLLAFDGLDVSHFPQDARGGYLGYHPADAAAAIEHLEALRAGGAEYLLIPQSACWWLDSYAEFRAHLEKHARLISRQQHLGILYALVHDQT